MNNPQNQSDPVYTVAVCHYNMRETVEESLESILTQVDDRFEILVVDDGSDDGSLEILSELKSKYDCLRVIRLEYDANRNLGKTRNISFQESKGEYILGQMDADNRYGPGVLDFVEVYHQIENQLDRKFYLKGKAINMAPRSLLLDIPYRNFKRAQDRDLWRRLFAANKMIWLEHEPFFEIMRDEYNQIEELKNLYNLRVSDFRSGVSYESYVSWCFEGTKLYQAFWRLFIGTLALLGSYKRGRMTVPEEFRQMGSVRRTIQTEGGTLDEMEEKYGVEVDKSKLSEFGRKVF